MAASQSAYVTAYTSLLGMQFPGALTTLLGVLQVAYYAGAATGPTVGAALYEAGGFMLPFGAVGAVIVLGSVLAELILPKEQRKEGGDGEKEEPRRFVDVVTDPSVIFAIYK